jgi:hypothetical protein
MTTETVLHPNDIKNLPPKDIVIHRHLFVGEKHWYVAGTYDPLHLFGYVNLGDPENAGWGDFTMEELGQQGVFLDRDWTPKPFGETTEQQR